jgi:HTH-type transcriptional regulator/antitoxin HigA
MLPVQFERDWSCHPGELLAEEIEERRWTVYETSNMLGWPYETLDRFLKGELELTPLFAADLERVTAISATFWCNLERMYREWLVNRPATPDAGASVVE